MKTKIRIIKFTLSIAIILCINAIVNAQCVPEVALPAITQFESSIPAEYQEKGNLVLLEPKSQLLERDYLANDPFIYPYEEVTLYISGEMNINPCNVVKSTKGFLGFGKKSYQARINNYQKVCAFNENINIELSGKSFSFSKCPNSNNCEQIIAALTDQIEASASNFSMPLRLQGFVNQRPNNCSGTKLASEGSYNLIVHVNSKPRARKFYQMLNEMNSFTLAQLKEWINPRMKSLFKVELSNKILAAVESKGGISNEEKIKILEYVVNYINPSNFKINSSLGELYASSGDFKNCIETLEASTKSFLKKENEYLLKSYFYSNQLAEDFDKLAYCLIEKEQRTDQNELMEAASSFSQAFKYYLDAKQFTKAYKAKLNQINVLKRINSITSLEASHNVIEDALQELKGLNLNDEIDLKERKSLVISNDTLIKKSITVWDYHEIVIENEVTINFEEHEDRKYEFTLNTERLVIGDSVNFIKPVVIRGISYKGEDDQKPPKGVGARRSPGDNGDQGDNGGNGDSSNVNLKIETRKLVYLGSLKFDLYGQNGGNGQWGGNGGKGGQAKCGPPKRSGGSGGLGGNGGNGGNGGDGGIVEINIYNSEIDISQDKICTKFVFNLCKGAKGVKGKNGKSGEGGDGKGCTVGSASGGAKPGPNPYVAKDGEDGKNGSYTLKINNSEIPKNKCIKC